MVTIRDVAREAGVSTITVSRALSSTHAGKVSPATRARVLEAARRLGYRPNIAARALKAQRTLQYGLVVPYVHRSYLPDVVQGVQDVATAHDYSCLLYLTTFQRDVEYQAFQRLISKGVDGVIWLPGPKPSAELAALAGTIPVVQLLYKEIQTLPAVLVDQRFGAYTATRHLLELGHTRIGCLMVPDRHGEERLRGFETAMRDAGLAPDPVWMLPDGTWESAYRAMREAGNATDRVTAWLCYSDTVALAAARALRERGFAVPSDVSVVGFDDAESSRYAEPPLTTVAIPKSEAGEQAMQLLLQQIAGEEAADRVLRPYLIVRSSTAPPRPTGRG